MVVVAVTSPWRSSVGACSEMVLVGEFQTLDIADGVRAVGRQTAGMRHGDGAIGIEVMSYSARAPENTARVDIGDAVAVDGLIKRFLRRAVPDRSHDAELARIDACR